MQKEDIHTAIKTIKEKDKESVDSLIKSIKEAEASFDKTLIALASGAIGVNNCFYQRPTW